MPSPMIVPDRKSRTRFSAGPLTIAAYLDVLNVYNAQNEESVRYSYDFSEKEAVTGLPIFPNLGIRGEL